MDIQFREAIQEDFEEIRGLVDAYFGKGFFNTKKVLGENCCCIVAIAQSTIIGMSCAHDVIPKYDLDFAGTFLASCEEIIGLLDIIVVEDSYRNQGIGSKLFANRLKKLSENGVSKFALFHWREGNFPEPKIAIRQGFKWRETLPFYWKIASISENFSCARCGAPPCNCSADLYFFEQNLI